MSEQTSEQTVAAERGRRKVREGLVVSDKMNKTVVVAATGPVGAAVAAGPGPVAAVGPAVAAAAAEAADPVVVAAAAAVERLRPDGDRVPAPMLRPRRTLPRPRRPTRLRRRPT